MQVPRYVPSGSLVEITARTEGARYLLRPGPELNRKVLAVVGRGLASQPVDLHAVSFMSNHWHALVSVADAQALARFTQFVHSNLARYAMKAHGWDGRVFRQPAFIIVGRSAEELRLRYVLAQGTKEGLVRRPLDWPGVHSARALIGEEVLVGIWRDNERERKMLTGGGKSLGRVPTSHEVDERYPIDFAPLPSWRDVSAGERIVRIRRMLSEIERDARALHPNPLGAAKVLAMDPLTRPLKSKRSRAPLIHTLDEEERIAFTMAREAFLVEFRDARKALRATRPAILPACCFPPTTPFRTTRAAVWSSVRLVSSVSSAPDK